MDSLYLGDVDVVKAVHSSLECMNIIQLVRPFRSFHNLLHLPQSPSLTRVPQVDAQLLFIRADPEAESTKANQKLNEDENRLQVD